MSPGGYRLLRWLIVALLAAAVTWALFALTTPRPPEAEEKIEETL
jgi:hypothetical protein